jgi:DisA bacterial checkpoint controller nucleotide-binding.
MFMKHKGNPGLVEVLTNATLALSAAGHGALIIVERNYDLRQLIESGTSVDAKVTSWDPLESTCRHAS